MKAALVRKMPEIAHLDEKDDGGYDDDCDYNYCDYDDTYLTLAMDDLVPAHIADDDGGGYGNVDCSDNNSDDDYHNDCDHNDGD